MRFAGSDSVQLGAQGLPANNQVQSVAFWLNYTAVPTGNTHVCVALTDGKASGSRLKLGFKDQRLAAFKSGGSSNLANANPPAPGWHHFGYVFDGNTHRLFVDGVQKATSTAAPDTGAVSNARLGANFDQTEAFTGQVDKEIYNRVLTAGEMAALFAAKTADLPPVLRCALSGARGMATSPAAETVIDHRFVLLTEASRGGIGRRSGGHVICAPGRQSR